MKAKAVSALRSKRGLRRASGAEPQVVGLTPQTTNDRRTDTMKTYLLRQPQTVESQNVRRPSRPRRVAAATTPEVLPPADRASRGPALFIGLDVHSDSIAVSLAPSDT